MEGRVTYADVEALMGLQQVGQDVFRVGLLPEADALAQAVGFDDGRRRRKGNLVDVRPQERPAVFALTDQRIDAVGVIRWTTEGVVICNDLNDQSNPALVSDGMGGAIITWVDSRDGTSNIYAQRINSAGIVQWAPDGIVV